MRTKVNIRVAAGAALALAMLAVPYHARAAEEAEQRRAEASRWSLALALVSGVGIGEQSGRIDNRANVISWPAGTVEPAPLRPPAQGSYNAISPYFGASLELMTPALDRVPGAPRLFAAAEILPTFATTGSVALEGAATQITAPPNQPPQNYLQSQLSGAGSRLTAQIMTTVIGASVGVAVPLEVRGHLLRIKPKAAWIRYGVMVDGRVLGAFKDDPVPQCAPQTFPCGLNTRIVELTGHGVEFFNALGPGLELELEVGRFGPIRPSIFLEGYGYRHIGNQSLQLAAQKAVDDVLGRAVYQTVWSFRTPDWMYRAGVGMRVRWHGAD